MALANLNFDFTLIKFEAPKEFQALGETLSHQRRSDAEDGAAHKTARRLGALFESLVPSTPQLLKAYGLRASEIIKSPNINPRGSRNDGPFQNYVGADGTSIWAAATSAHSTAGTHAPLSMHLLACMLARAWNPDEATSIWVELVKERQKNIEAVIDHEPQFFSACMAARQKISRKQLAMWDASARSWLRSADEAMSSDRTKLMLILKNTSLNVSEGNSTYAKVIDAWCHAMVGMEKLINGMPQQVSDGSVLLALSAWHIFPDLLVLGLQSKSVKFADPLVRDGGIITIGLQFSSETSGQGMQWSLALSHLRYYGDAVQADTDEGTSRITMNQLLLVAFGSLLSSWEVKQKEELASAKWIIALWKLLNSGTPEENEVICSLFRWLHVLYKAATYFISCQDNDMDICSMLVTWGRRRARDFLDSNSTIHQPFFGLCNPSVQAGLLAGTTLESGVAYLREVALRMGLRSGDAVIRLLVRGPGVDWYEFATAIPHRRASRKRSQDGTATHEDVHTRWLYNHPSSNEDWIPGSGGGLSLPTPFMRCECEAWCSLDCACYEFRGTCNDTCHPHSARLCQGVGLKFDARRLELERLGEICLDANQRDFQRARPLSKDEQHFTWRNPPIMYHNHNRIFEPPQDCPSLIGGGWSCSCFEPCYRPAEYRHQISFHLVHGANEGLGLFVRCKDEAAATNFQSNAANQRTQCLGPSSGVEIFQGPCVNKAVVIEYLIALSGTEYMPAGQEYFYFGRIGIQTLVGSELQLQDHWRSLTALYAASEVYDKMVGPPISLRVVSLPLHKSLWSQDFAGARPELVDNFISISTIVKLRKERVQKALKNDAMSRAQKFACIAMFESGVHDLNPNELQPVIAMASANSIFVAAELLSDPSNFYSGGHEVRRIVGNIGRPGISMMVAPQQALRIRPLGNNFRVVQHAKHDLRREDNFQGTSLHLSFTDWKLTLNTGNRGAIDEGVSLIESVVSIHDQGRWVADLDITAMDVHIWDHECICGDRGDPESLTAVDQWEELLDAPDNLGIVRANKNWVARLAAAAVRWQQGMKRNTFVVRPGSVICMKCLAALYLQETGKARGIIID